MNISENSLKNLKHNYSHWKSGKTTSIRIPEVLKNDILDYAKKLDNKEVTDKFLKEKIEKIVSKIDNEESGYKTRSAKKLIDDLRAIIK